MESFLGCADQGQMFPENRKPWGLLVTVPVAEDQPDDGVPWDVRAALVRLQRAFPGAVVYTLPPDVVCPCGMSCKA